MNDSLHPPPEHQAILKASIEVGFKAMCEEKTGSLLRTLAATKPKSRFLEIGTGTGVSTSWILDGMDKQSKLTTVDLDPTAQSIAKKYLSHHQNVAFLTVDAEHFIQNLNESDQFDFIFADSFPGKFFLRNELLAHLRTGGFYIIDDLLPQPNWPKVGHGEKVERLILELESDPTFRMTKLNWSSGILIATKI